MSAVDTLNDMLAQAEAKIASMGFTTTAYVPIGGGTQIGWCKVGAGWMLVHRRPDQELEPLLKSSRMVRVNAAHKLTALVDQLRHAEAAVDADVRGAIEGVQKFLATAPSGSAPSEDK